MSNTGRDQWIDLLRALSAIGVVLFHFNSVPLVIPDHGASPIWHALWLHGHWGVGVFFALSGYCLFPGWSRAGNAGEFLQRRARRIFPTYWCSLLLVLGLAVAVRLSVGVNDVAVLPASIAAWFATFFLLTTPVTTIPTINWVYWTLSCIAGFYLVMGLLLLVRTTSRLRFLAALHILVCAADAIFHPPASGAFFLVHHWPVFGCGLALAVFHAGHRIGRLMLVVSLLHVIWSVAMGSDPTHYLLVGAVTTGLIALTRTLSFPGWLRPAAWLGGISYSLYLVHVPIGVYLLMRFAPDHFATFPTYAGTQLLLLAGCLAFAWGFYWLAERPFLPSAPVVKSRPA